MKNITTALLAVILFASCKKCYTCTERVNTKYTNGAQVANSVNRTQVCGLSKGDKADYEKEHTYAKDEAPAGGIPYTKTTTTVCE